MNLCLYLTCVSSLLVPRGVIQNGARVRSQALFPVIRPLPVSPVGSRTSAIRWVTFACIALDYSINVSQGFPCANTFPCRHTQTHPHPHAHIQKPSNTHTHAKQTMHWNFPLIVYIITSLLCLKVRGIHTLTTVENILSRCVYIMVSHTSTHTQTGLLKGEASWFKKHSEHAWTCTSIIGA